MTKVLAIRVKAGAAAAPFEQIREQITALIAAGNAPGIGADSDRASAIIMTALAALRPRQRMHGPA
ncbi:hypothetical protein C5C00_00740 [Rathayibacter rathayi]|uniref:hypothetical protein n=1 Tax=Rathayibacter rathayi TaxID=33887 RepID=UPI000CE7558D|nr:hypothetical protein [Rathayibacter rathayi]PPG90328.1 hypothetical protein C5C47_01970 [Rathayibacter rathayi]PPG99107.1 hypothetical protein C5C00_00740 [Rathayibacter rathayi]